MNRRPALRVDDPGIHAACCGANTWTAVAGSATVFINGKGAHRMGDRTRHCGGTGTLIEGSPNVIVGESSSSGAGQSARSPRSAGGASSAEASSGAAPGGDAPGSVASGRDAPGSAASGGDPPGSAASGGDAPGSTGAGSGQGPDGNAPAAARGPATAEAANPPTSDEPTWLEIVLLGEDGKGVTAERYVVSLPGGATRTGFLDDDGRALFDDLSPGTCKVSFPDLDSEAWQPAEEG